jgi:hypothetical protein
MKKAHDDVSKNLAKSEFEAISNCACGDRYFPEGLEAVALRFL